MINLHAQNLRSMIGCYSDQRHDRLLAMGAAEIERLQSLAVCSSDEGTSFYYKDDWEARGKKIEKQDRLLGLYRRYKETIDTHHNLPDSEKKAYIASISDEMTEIMEQIAKQEETL